MSLYFVHSKTREADGLDELVEHFASSAGIVVGIPAGEGIRRKRSVPHKLKHQKVFLLYFLISVFLYVHI